VVLLVFFDGARDHEEITISHEA